MKYDALEAGPELDALVAEKVMGSKRHAWEPSQLSRCSGDCDGDEDCQCTGTVAGFKCGLCGAERETQYWPLAKLKQENGFCEYPRRYSTDITAAWQVVEFLQMSIHPKWGAMTHNGKGLMVSSTGETATLAICLTALKAVEA